MPVGNAPKVPSLNSDSKPNLSEELLVWWSLCVVGFQRQGQATFVPEWPRQTLPALEEERGTGHAVP